MAAPSPEFMLKYELHSTPAGERRMADRERIFEAEIRRREGRLTMD